MHQTGFSFKQLNRDSMYCVGIFKRSSLRTITIRSKLNLYKFPDPDARQKLTGTADNFRQSMSPPAESTQADDNRVKIQVGERQFITCRDTLTGESAYFKARLSKRWDDREKDGSYFIDANPDMFDNVLHYLRSAMFPLFFDAGTQSFDYGKYAALLGEARYFGIPRLEDWISKARFHDAVRIETITTMVPDVEAGEGIDRVLAKADTKTDVSTNWGTRRVYVCPRDIDVHRGDWRKCGQACEKARTRDGVGIDFEEESVLRAAVTSRRLIFDPTACFDDGGDIE